MAASVELLFSCSLVVGRSFSVASPAALPHSCLWPFAALRRSCRGSCYRRSQASGFFCPLGARKAEKKRAIGIVAMTTGQSTDQADVPIDAFKSLQNAWEKTDDKLAIGGLGFAALILLWASTGLISAIDKLPLIPTFFEFVGILFSGWFIYRYLVFKPDREELLQKVEDTVVKITGSEI
eukprot:c21305_g1_i1 orf=129-668(+)